MRHASFLTTLVILIAFISCNHQLQNPESIFDESNLNTLSIAINNDSTNHQIATKKNVIIKSDARSPSFPQERTQILANLKSKINDGEPLIVHVFVPLCDNKNQGIIPTSPSIGNGMDAKRNLYWGTSKGMKRFFSELPDWQLIGVKENVNEFVLDRAIFRKIFPNKAIVMLVMDAYKGDEMKLCLEHYFKSLAGIKTDTIIMNNNSVPAYGNADLIIFNGHNGLMDEEPNSFLNIDARPKDAVAIACISKDYFKPFWKKANGYPLVTTTGLMYPGAFCTEFIINNWSMLKSAEVCRKAAGKAYYKYKPKSGPNGSNNLFSTGW